MRHTFLFISLIPLLFSSCTSDTPQARLIEMETVEFNGSTMGSYILGIYERPDSPKAVSADSLSLLQTEHLAYLGSMFNNGFSLATGPFEVASEEKMRGLVLFPGKLGHDKVRELMENDPLVKAGRLKVTTLKWWTDAENLKFFSVPK